MNPKDYAYILDEVLENKNEKQQDEILARFKELLTKSKEAHLAGGITKELQKIQREKERGNITYITSSSKLSDDQRRELESAFPKPTDFSENPSLLGGVAVRQGDKVYNATLRKKIETLKWRL